MRGIAGPASTNFNPRSREGSDFHVWLTTCKEDLISIHAPARGATINDVASPTGYTISIHAPARGATGYIGIFAVFLAYFNPRSREGSDLGRCNRPYHRQRFQSTLPRGERPLTWGITALPTYFNPRFREGSDGIIAFYFGTQSQFQSTLPRGERPRRGNRRHLL